MLKFVKDMFKDRKPEDLAALRKEDMEKDQVRFVLEAQAAGWPQENIQSALDDWFYGDKRKKEQLPANSTEAGYPV